MCAWEEKLNEKHILGMIERGSLKIMPKGNKKSHHHTTHIIATPTYIQKWDCKYEYLCVFI